MAASADILVVAATARELISGHGWRTLECGVGPVDAAATTAAAIVAHRPRAILHVGIAGARRAAALPPAVLVIGVTAHYVDLGVPERFAPRVVTGDAMLVAAAQRALPLATLRDIGTTAHIGGTFVGAHGCDVEAMEGFAVLRAAQLAGIPAIEVRAISNDIEESDRALWHFSRAFDAITVAIPLLVAEIALCVH